MLPEKKRYEPGETARLQVRMPFREATALVAVEREGVIDTRVVTLRGDDPTIELKIDKAWGAQRLRQRAGAARAHPRGALVLVLHLGLEASRCDWWRAFRYEGREYQAPTAMVDLAKPAFKLGVAALQVGLAEHELQVERDGRQAAVRGAPEGAWRASR